MTSRASDILSCLLETGNFSDFTMISGDREFKLHKSVVCLQSRMIRRALEGDFQEANTAVLEVREFHSPIIKYMVDFLYKGDYEVVLSDLASLSLYGDERSLGGVGFSYPKEKPKCDSMSILNNESYMKTVLCHIHVNAAGDYYDIPDLQKASITKLETLFSNDWRPKLYPAIIKAALHKAGDENLHDFLATTATHHLGDLVEESDFDISEWDKQFTARVLKQCAWELTNGRGKGTTAGEYQNKPDQGFWRPVRCNHCGDSVYGFITPEMESGVLAFVCNLCRGPF